LRTLIFDTVDNALHRGFKKAGYLLPEMLQCSNTECETEIARSSTCLLSLIIPPLISTFASLSLVRPNLMKQGFEESLKAIFVALSKYDVMVAMSSGFSNLDPDNFSKTSQRKFSICRKPVLTCQELGSASCDKNRTFQKACQDMFSSRFLQGMILHWGGAISLNDPPEVRVYVLISIISSSHWATIAPSSSCCIFKPDEDRND
jgi:hypothetical protein